MKSVLISIQPYWVFLIIARKMGWDIPNEKTIEVRKDFPKDKLWNKVTHIYCGKNKKSFNRIPKQYQSFMKKLLGKVIGEFVCARIVAKFKYLITPKGLECACLSEKEVDDYLGFNGGYGWHISDLKIYDKPKELGEFFVKGDCENFDFCYRCKYYYRGDAFSEAAGIESGCTLYDDLKSLSRPPQSWCYIEEQEKQK